MVMGVNNQPLTLPVFINGEYWKDMKFNNSTPMYLKIFSRSKAVLTEFNTVRILDGKVKQVHLRFMDEPVFYLYLNDDEVYIENGNLWLK
jgi:hypothetical protein